MPKRAGQGKPVTKVLKPIISIPPFALDEIGTVVKSLRTGAGLRLRDIEAISGISGVFLSEVERGIKTLSILSLRLLFSVYGYDVKIMLVPKED